MSDEPDKLANDGEIVAWMRDRGVVEYERSPERVRIVLGPEPSLARVTPPKNEQEREAQRLERRRTHYRGVLGYSPSDELLARLP